MAIPERPTAEQQVWPGHAPVPSWDTPTTTIGRKGLNLVSALDDLDVSELSRMVNVVSQQGGLLYTRLGQTALATTAGGQRVHSLYRINDPVASTFTRLAGSNTDLYRGQSGALALIDSNYSGDPLTFAGVNLPLTGLPYVFIGDRLKMTKVARTGGIDTIGLGDALLTATALGTQLNVSIAAFDAGDGTQAASWTMTAGTDTAGAASGAPTAADTGAGTTVAFTTVPGGAGAGLGYYSTVSIAKVVDLSVFSGPVTVVDQDLIAFDVLIDRPDRLLEFRIYFVISAFTAGVIPGMSTTQNTDAWWKSITPADLTPFVDITASTVGATGTTPDEASIAQRERQLLESFKEDTSVEDDRASVVNSGVLGYSQTSRNVNPQTAPGRNSLTRFGITGLPIRRGDFARIGADTSLDWGDVKGIVIVIRTNTNQAVVLTFNGMQLQGGSGPDTTDLGSQPYDYRVINYRPDTGTRGNPSAVQAEANWLNPIRQPITVTPTATGTSSIRQRIYRRGGGAATSQDWYYVGQNASDGAAFSDTKRDDEIVTEETLEIDNDQPVTSVNSTGTAIKNAIVPVFFLVDQYCFALGDIYQPGRLYRSKLAAPENWPSTSYYDVCSSTEELMNGGMYGSAGFVFSRQWLYAILLNGDGSWTTEPTSCAEGLVGRWAMTVTPYGIAFVSPYGVRLTTGGPPEHLSDAQMLPLFQGRAVNGMNPIDFTVPTALLLEYHDNELWMSYQDTGAVRRQLIYNFIDKTWRGYLFGEPVAAVYSEPVQGTGQSLLLGGNATGQAYTHSGFSDDGAAIAYQIRTGAWNFNDPRREKLLSEVLVTADLQTATLNVSPFLNDEFIVVTPQTVVGTAGMRPYYFEPFGTTPQHARNVSVDLAGNAPTGARLAFNLIGVTQQIQPEITYQQPTPWEELPGGEGYCYGMLITCDTAGAAKDVRVEYTVNNSGVLTAADLVITANGRRKMAYSWPSVLAQQIRLRPTTPCEPWMRFKIEWLTDPEPPRYQGWDSNWQPFGSYADKWLKGILIEADTFGLAKDLVVDIDQAAGAVSLGSLTFSGRTIQHLSFPKQRGRLFKLRATDAMFGKLFRWQPIFDEEPYALTRWESEERPFPGMDGRWQKPLDAWVCVRSSATVSWQVTTYGSGTTALFTTTYTIASTGGVKQKARVPMEAVKGLLFAHLFTSSAAFWLYREESEVLVEDFNTGEARWVPLFLANDDLDPARTMGNAAVAAATPGGA